MIDWNRALILETKIAQIIQEQEENGFKFDLPKALRSIEFLANKRNELYDRIRPSLTLEIEQEGAPILKPFKKNGEYSKMVTDWLDSLENSVNVGGAFTRISWHEPDLGSRQKLIKQLMRHGWKPELFTDKGQPKLTEAGVPVESLLNIDAEVGGLIAKWFTFQHRQSQIEGWVQNVRPDGRISARARSCGTNTARMTHSIVVNVPKASKKVLFGPQMRDLFTVEQGNILLGFDAAALEGRVMAHYTTPLDDGEFAHELLDGDIHTKNANHFGVSRDEAKTIFYGLIYGSQPRKVSQMLNCPIKRATEVFNSFWEVNHALGKLRDETIKSHNERGWVPGIDGRKIYTRSDHSALNALFQSCGSIVMKTAAVSLYEEAKSRGIRFKMVGNFHDEIQSELEIGEFELYELNSEQECLDIINPNAIWMKPTERGGKWITGYARYGELAVLSLRKAGELLNMRIKMDADYVMGPSWRFTH
jgi:hypothetical protein